MKATDARVVLTGATGGIGRAAAVALARAGAAVMLVGRSPARLSAQAAELARRHPGVDIECHAADLDRPCDIEALCDAAQRFRANVLVLGAGVPSFGRFQSITPRDMQQAVHTNLLAPMLLTHALLPWLASLSRAQVICVGSALGRIGLPGFSVYSATKFGLRGFAEALRRELSDGPVRVQYLGPRSTRTSFNDSNVEAYNAATGTAMDTPETVAAALLRLLEEESAECFVGFPEKLAVRLNGLAPALLDGAFARHRRSLPAPSTPSTEAKPET